MDISLPQTFLKMVNKGSMSIFALVMYQTVKNTGSYPECKGLPGGAGEEDDAKKEEEAASDDDGPADNAMKLFLVHVSKQLTLGGVSGMCAGYATKTVAKQVAYGIGLFFIGIQVLAYNGIITVPWDSVEKKLKAAADLDGDGDVDVDDLLIVWKKVKKVLSYGLPNAAGFVGGFMVGIKYL
mmetsp:Transcript_5641/g.11171  ORF Transcript_5641/g.11171 Transcript_5641/m.11171 type:complete len:182 (-) Transcript_5641:91-636(-)|eukprot:CAMPEP_0170172064 /NCGR_PEP_ID=MMETSP0040_2-20121228/5294_1 /TAXON_ID=641309 /ORGANISM="Lotharella oceanica, Strain CCMP622" /LENGTH=181 /DNA_ID=CAMNT_0010412523 /DNA_START=81 /DNA_END=626 /DNA_ORIENTATION=-